MNRLQKLAGVMTEGVQLDEDLTGPMYMSKNGRLHDIADLTAYNAEFNHQAIDDANEIARRLLTLLAQPNRSAEADRILSFLLK
jgi:hypothetical protein